MLRIYTIYPQYYAKVGLIPLLEHLVGTCSEDKFNFKIIQMKVIPQQHLTLLWCNNLTKSFQDKMNNITDFSWQR